MASTCPYENLKDQAYWAKAVRDVANSEINPATTPKFNISRSTKIGTIGSCFAQNMARYLVSHDFNYLVTEPGPPWLTPDLKKEHNYGVFSGRYGNVYTTLQLLQLQQRSLGLFRPAETPWTFGDGLADPFRPFVEPNGFSSEAELDADRSAHLEAVKRLFESVDVLVVTLGLTEGWVANTDNAALPACPGCGAGEFSDSDYTFRNFRVSEVVDQLEQFADQFHEINAKGKILLTVSPVPLTATFEDKHVLQSTVYSKSVLRAAAGELTEARDFIDYFPSYEVITWTYNSASYFGSNKRSIATTGVDHVMRCFFEAYAPHENIKVSGDAPPKTETRPPENTLINTIDPTPTDIDDDEVICDEDRLLEHLGQEKSTS